MEEYERVQGVGSGGASSWCRSEMVSEDPDDKDDNNAQ